MDSKDFKSILNIIKQVTKQKGFIEGLKGGAISGLAVSIGYDVVKSLIKNAQQTEAVKKSPVLTSIAGNADNVFSRVSIDQKKSLISALQSEISKAEAIEVPFEEVKVKEKV